MSPNAKWVGISLRSWWTLFYLLNIIILGGIVASVLVKNWVIGKFEDGGENEFEGGLLKSHKLEISNFDGERDYDEISDDFCDLYDLSKDISNSQAEKLFNSFCNMFKNLYKAGRMFIGLETTAGVAMILWILSMAIYCSRGKGIALNYLCSCIALISHVIAVVIYIVLTNTKLDSCDEFPLNGDDPELCADYGPIIALAVLGLLGLQCFLFFIVACKVQKQGHLSLSKNPPESAPQNTSGVLPNQMKTKENEEIPKASQFNNSQHLQEKNKNSRPPTKPQGNSFFQNSNYQDSGRVFRPSNKTQDINSYQNSNFQRRK